MHPRLPIALIFFSRQAAQEGHVKNWLGRRRQADNVRIAELLIAKTEENFANAGLDLIHFDERGQRGKDFGERLSNAFADVFAMGYQAAVAVGNDSPDLAKADWEQLRLALENGKTVLGPTLRGGAYLIGLQAEGFDPRAMAALPWQTSQTYTALHAFLSEAGDRPILTLGTLRDLNTWQDLHAFIRSHEDAFTHVLRRCIRVKLVFPPLASNPIQTLLPTQVPQRGPPAVHVLP